MCPINRPFGNGVYFTKDFSTANYYSPDRGNPNAQRFLLVCKLILGNIYKYGKHPDTQLEQANGSVVYHSARGFKWGDYEYIIYNQNQIRPKYLICYNFINTNHEIQIYASLLNPINPMMFVPANPANFSSFTVNHSITGIIISRTFNEFLKTLERIANICNKTQEILKLITKLLFIQNINVPIFMQEVMHLLQYTLSANMERSLNYELAKCKIIFTHQEAGLAHPTTWCRSIKCASVSATISTIPASEDAA